jgi:hypothetical protein
MVGIGLALADRFGDFLPTWTNRRCFNSRNFPLTWALAPRSSVNPLHWNRVVCDYSERRAADGGEGRLVSMHSFGASWDSWEIHPAGSELVVCTARRMTLHQEINGRRLTIALTAGEAVINPPGAWPTADVEGPCTAQFITVLGTQIRPR